MLKKVAENLRGEGYAHPFAQFVAKRNRNYSKLMFDGRECLGADFEERRGKRTLKKA
jgi:hypothetical protein